MGTKADKLGSCDKLLRMLTIILKHIRIIGFGL